MSLTTEPTGETDRAAGAWLTEFCQRLETLWRTSGRKNKTLRSFILVMNKRDKVDKRKADRYRAAFQKILCVELREALGTIQSDIEVMPCAVVKSKHKESLVEAVIIQLLKELGR